MLIELNDAPRPGYRQNATFVMDRRTQATVRKFKDSTGNDLWQPPVAAPPSPGVTNPYPLLTLKNFTLPVAIGSPPIRMVSMPFHRSRAHRQHYRRNVTTRRR